MAMRKSHDMTRFDECDREEMLKYRVARWKAYANSIVELTSNVRVRPVILRATPQQMWETPRQCRATSRTLRLLMPASRTIRRATQKSLKKSSLEHSTTIADKHYRQTTKTHFAPCDRPSGDYCIKSDIHVPSK